MASTPSCNSESLASLRFIHYN